MLFSHTIAERFSQYKRIRAQYHQIFGTTPRLLFPKTFNEHLQRRKLLLRNPIYTTCSDKLQARTFICRQVGHQYLPQLLGAYEHPDQIDLDSLPAKFVLKCTHGSGWNVLCEDRAKLDWKTEADRLEEWLSLNFYQRHLEPNYLHHAPKIVAEEWLEPPINSPGDLPDYKIFVFRGQPRLIQVDATRTSDHRRTILTPEWEVMDVDYQYLRPATTPAKPPHLDKMLDLAARLGEPFGFVRADFFETDRGLLVGELTFYPEAGLGRFDPPEFDELFGSFFTSPATTPSAFPEAS